MADQHSRSAAVRKAPAADAIAPGILLLYFALAMLAMPRPPERASLQRAALAAGYFLLAPLLVLLAYRRVSDFEFVADARFLIENNATLRDLGSFRDQLTHDYFWSSSGNKIPYWRPVTKLSWLLEFQWFGGWAGGYLWVQVVMHVLTVVGVQLLSLKLGLRPAFALLAAVIMALHPGAIEPVALIMARSDVAAVCFGVWSLIAWLWWRERRTSARRYEAPALAGLHSLLLMLALGSKEAALGWVALLVLWSIFEGDLQRGQRRQLLSLVPALVLSAAYLALRRALLASETAGLEALNLGFEPLRVFSSLGLYLRNLLPVVESSVRNLSFAEAGASSTLIKASITLLSAALVGWFLISRREVRIFTLLLGAISLLLPVLLSLDISVPEVERKYPLADRWLYHALPCASIVLARLIELAVDRFHFVQVKVALVISSLAWVALVLSRSAGATEEMGSELRMLDNEDRLFYYGVPAEFRTHDDDCSFHERKLVRELIRGRPEATLALSPGALAVCGERASLKQHVLEAYVRLRRFEQALPLAKELAQSPPPDGRAQGALARNIGLTLFHTGDPVAAAPYLLRAAERGLGDCHTLVMLAEAARAKGDVETGSAGLEKAFFCGGQRDPSLLIAAATWLTEAEREKAARRLLQVSKVYRLSADQAAQVERLEAALGTRAGAQP